MDEGYEKARVINELAKIEQELPHLNAESLVYEYLKRSGQKEIVEDLRRPGRPPKGGKSRTETLKEWREGDSAELRYLANVLDPFSYRGIVQRDLARWVQQLMNDGMTAEEAAYRIEKISDPRVDHAEALRAWKRQIQK